MYPIVFTVEVASAASTTSQITITDSRSRWLLDAIEVVWCGTSAFHLIQLAHLAHLAFWRRLAISDVFRLIGEDTSSATNESTVNVWLVRSHIVRLLPSKSSALHTVGVLGGDSFDLCSRILISSRISSKPLLVCLMKCLDVCHSEGPSHLS